jgi:predicted nucleic acid-binding protein
VVVDTSVLVAGISGFKPIYVVGQNASADILHDWALRNSFRWLISSDILDEYKEILKRLRVRPHVIGRVVNLVRERAEEVRILSPSGISRDPGDDPFCACAERGRADLLITLNLKDFPQARLRARILSPADFLSRR